MEATVIFKATLGQLWPSLLGCNVEGAFLSDQMEAMEPMKLCGVDL